MPPCLPACVYVCIQRLSNKPNPPPAPRDHRDMFGAPDVLIRKDKAFLSNYTPSATDDDLAPGAG